MLNPELARDTRINNAMRADFSRRLLTSAQIVQVLKSWNMDLDKNLVEIPARVLMPEKINFGNQKHYALIGLAPLMLQKRLSSEQTKS
ncbi:protein aubergine-like [Scaptodrosophila lebanonensis]|uniref:Protein aubergine-like n=1 Tax=Drosophila lebanonensis TaxID=7225 RepID=A0A6J2TVH6_DROLE|nr:protein aubergine-like [Scaptodrosophila lebanonensis]